MTPSGDPRAMRPIRTLLPMACDGVGPSQTCLQLARGAQRAGADISVFANRNRGERPPFALHLALPGALARLPYPWVHPAASRWTEARLLRAIRPGDVAYLWPAASLRAHEILHDRGNPIVLEGINTRMAAAKRRLDDAYEAFGIPPGHGITQARIDEEEAKFRLATAIFAPSRFVAAALEGSPLQGRILRSSYGVDTALARTERAYPAKPALTVMFCGYACIRKGAHLLLDAWREVPGPHRLRLVGRIEPAIASRYRDLLSSDRVEVVGFTPDVDAQFESADLFVLPSLEEGDPLVTYEAALHGLPIIASPIGAGGLGDKPGNVMEIDPLDRLAFGEALNLALARPALRAELGRAARQSVMGFDWADVGAARARALMRFLADGPSNL